MKSLAQLAAELPCPTCRQQFPGFRALYEHWKATPPASSAFQR